MSMRDDVLKARSVRQYELCDASHPEFEWMVTFYDDESAAAHWLVEKTEWVRNHCPLSQNSIDAANAMLRSLGSTSGDVVNVVNVPVGGMGIRINPGPGGEGQEETTEGQKGTGN